MGAKPVTGPIPSSPGSLSTTLWGMTGHWSFHYTGKTGHILERKGYPFKYLSHLSQSKLWKTLGSKRKIVLTDFFRVDKLIKRTQKQKIFWKYKKWKLQLFINSISRPLSWQWHTAQWLICLANDKFWVNSLFKGTAFHPWCPSLRNSYWHNGTQKKKKNEKAVVHIIQYFHERSFRLSKIV